jgi:hypothetical protein
MEQKPSLEPNSSAIAVVNQTPSFIESVSPSRPFHDLLIQPVAWATCVAALAMALETVPLLDLIQFHPTLNQLPDSRQGCLVW